MLGAVPLAIGFGEGAELRRPLGITIVGGLLVSQVLTLFRPHAIEQLIEKVRFAGDSSLERAGSELPVPVEIRLRFSSLLWDRPAARSRFRMDQRGITAPILGGRVGEEDFGRARANSTKSDLHRTRSTTIRRAACLCGSSCHCRDTEAARSHLLGYEGRGPRSAWMFSNSQL
jgi:hypothetical protein